MNYQIKVKQIHIRKGSMYLNIEGFVKCDIPDSDYIPKAKLILCFENEKEDRRIPFIYDECEKRDGGFWFKGEGRSYLLNQIFWKTKDAGLRAKMSFALQCGNEYEEHIVIDYSETEVIFEKLHFDCSMEKDGLYFQKKPWYIKPYPFWKLALLFPVNLVKTILAVILIPWFGLEGLASLIGWYQLEKSITTTSPIRRIIGHINIRFSKLAGGKISVARILKNRFLRVYKKEVKQYEIIPNRITFISPRRTDLTGNFAFVYEKIKDEPGLDIRFLFNGKQPKDMTKKEIREFCHVCAVSKTIVLDEFTPQIHYLDLREGTTLIQLWHACGAFKTFGFTRMGKPFGSPQGSPMHRSYDYVTVSSTFCKKCHSEGFGIPTNHVVPTGIPRTDVFFDEEHKARVRKEFYEQYPALADKKLILFAPTFRGFLKSDAFYPMERFRIDEVLEGLGEDYAIIVKHHPFVTKAHPIPEAYAARVIDLSANSELNDLMFVSDLIITDYSSLIFEASLLKVPMIFYVYDLEEYIEDRDFYFDLKMMSPGKLVYSQTELIEAIQNQDYGLDKMEEFTKLFFDAPDGKATERVAALILDTMK